MQRVRVAIIGHGRLGHACAAALEDCPGLELAGIVRRGDHIRDLRGVDVALVCVPTALTLAVASELLEQRFAVVECATLEGSALEAHHAELFRVAELRRSCVMAGAGWDPGVLTILQRAFAMLIPHGASELTRRPAAELHHVAEALPGVRAALAADHPALFAARAMLDAAQRLPRLGRGGHRYSLELSSASVASPPDRVISSRRAGAPERP